jgi:hypothetical protein
MHHFLTTNQTTGSHPYLAQVPLAVSPFVSLPTATTLPYTYKALPSSLPPSSTGSVSTEEKNKYIVSSSGHAAHPDDIIASCKALQAYVQKLTDDADKELKEWEEKIAARELAEKRRVAPGWLDSEARILEPERHAGKKLEAGSPSLMDEGLTKSEEASLPAPTGGGDELDRAFGGIDINKT